MTGRFRFSPAGKAVIIFIACALVSAAYCYYFFDGFPGSSDACDYAGLARNLIQGKGFAINHVFPLSLVFCPELPQPNCMWAPAYPLLLALVFKLIGISDNTILLTNIVLFCILLIAGYFLARKYSDSKTAFVFLLFLGFSQYAYSIIIYGSPEVMAAVLLLLSVMILDHKNPIGLVASAFIFGLAVLSRYQLIVLLPFYLILLDKSYKKLSMFALVVFGVCSWWLIRNFIVFGDPLFTLQRYGEYSKGMGLNDSYYYTYKSFEPLSLFDVIRQYPIELLKKVIAGVPLFLGRLPRLLNIFAFFLVIWSYIFLGKDNRLARLMKFTAAGMAAYIFLCLLDGQHSRHLFIFVPLLTIIAAAGFQDFIQRSGLLVKKYGYLVTLLILIVPYNFPEQEIQYREKKALYRHQKEVYMMLTGSAEGAITSDASSGLWWYSGLDAVWLPANFETLIKVDSLVGLQGVYLQESAWPKAFSSEQIASIMDIFSYRREFSDGSILYLKPPRIP